MTEPGTTPNTYVPTTFEDVPPDECADCGAVRTALGGPEGGILLHDQTCPTHPGKMDLGGLVNGPFRRR